MDTDDRQRVVDEFTKGKPRILIASTQAAGEGVTLYPCDEFILLERQWNPANEEQAEARGIHPESKAAQINATYFLATGTIDEYFTELVEKKRGLLKQTVGGIVGAERTWSEDGLMRELAEIIRVKGGKKWRL
jgi:SNF2 family DNA or RNA helicase